MDSAKRMRWIRWIAVIPAAVSSWYAVLILGILSVSVLNALCPEDQKVSGACFAPWYSFSVDVLICVLSALSGATVLSVSVWVAPSHQRQVAIGVFVAGSLIAVAMAVSAGPKSYLAAAMTCVVSALVLRFWLRRLPKDRDGVVPPGGIPKQT